MMQELTAVSRTETALCKPVALSMIHLRGSRAYGGLQSP